MLRGFREHRRLGNPVENGIHGDFVFTEAQAKYRQLIRLKRRLYRNSARDTETNRYKGVAEGDARDEAHRYGGVRGLQCRWQECWQHTDRLEFSNPALSSDFTRSLRQRSLVRKIT